MSKLPRNMITRSMELLKLAAKVGSEQLSNADVVGKQVEQAKAMVDSLGRLKGAAMKVGQLLSMDFADLFPPEVRQVLEQLQNSSPHFMTLSEVEAILKKEIPEHFADLQNLSVEPIAAASIGQVHSAQWKGKDIVLKIQYPGVASSIESDIMMLKGVVQSLIVLSRKKMDLEPLFHELKEVFKNETNYKLELQNLLTYKDNLKDYPSYSCPLVYPELSTEKVLTMSHERGKSLKDWIQSKPSAERKEALGRKILDLYAIEFFDNLFVQSDPNPGNFIVSDDDKIILLDFGAVKKFETEFVDNYVTLMKVVHKKDMPATIFQAIEMGFINPKENTKVKELFYKMIRSSLCAFDAEEQPFDFTDKAYFDNTKHASHDFGKMSEFSPPPHEIIFLHRKLVGIFGVLRDLGLKIDLLPYWKRVTGSL